MKKIAMILHTSGIEYDDRIRKEIQSVKSLYPNIDFHIFAILDSRANESGDFISSYGVNYTVPLLRSRTKYPQGGHLLLKAWDFYKTVSPQLKYYDAIWCADVQPFFFLLLSRKPKVWDLHEIPELFLRNIVTKILLRHMMKRCKVIIHANAPRIHYLKEQSALDSASHHIVIRNFPDEAKAKTTDDVFDRFIQWLGDDDCIYLQGATDYNRCEGESFEGILGLKGIKAVAVGRYNKQIVQEIRGKYGDEFDNRIFLTGLVPQEMTPHYIKRCKASLVLYRNVSANNYYCEPNRMFQSIMNGCPVVVGNNPPMKEYVERYNLGVVLPSDGSSVNDIKEGLKIVLEKRDSILRSIHENKKVIQWNSQDGEFRQVISRLFDI